MGRNLSPEEVRNERLVAMPAPLGELHYELWNQVNLLHDNWLRFRTLYACDDGPDTLELLNNTAPGFFGRLYYVLWFDVLLHICRLTDPVQSCGKSTLTIRRLPDEIPDEGLRKDVQALVDDALEKRKFAKDWRDRRLAHRELPPLDGAPTPTLADASRRHVEEVLVPLREIMNVIEHHYLKSSTLYQTSIDDLGDTQALIAYLKRGLEAVREEENAQAKK